MSQLRSQRRYLLALIAFFVALVGPATVAQAREYGIKLPPYRYSPFYIPPSPLPAGQPGDIIRWKKLYTGRAITRARAGTTTYMVMYLSRSALDEPIAVTGTVMIPNITPAQGIANRPIIGYGNEAQGLGDNCAVSRLMVYGHTGELALSDPMLKLGYAVASTDYEGLGTPAVHTFGVAQSAARSVLDMVRAARNLEVAALPKDGPVALFGYSQGGAAVGLADEIQPWYAPDVKLTAVAGGGAAVDPLAFSKLNSGSMFSSVNFAASAGFDAAYPELKLKDILNAEGVKANKSVYTACIESIFTLAFQRSRSFLTEDVYSDPKWLKRFDENRLGHTAPKTPTYYFHAIYDQAAPYRAANQLRREWCAGGTPLRYLLLPLVEHVSAGPLWMPQAAKWVQAQLEGKIDAGNCGHYGPPATPAPTTPAPTTPAPTTPNPNI